MKSTRLIWFILVGLTAAIELLPVSQANGTKSAARAVTFNKDIAPIFFKSCAECRIGIFAAINT